MHPRKRWIWFLALTAVVSIAAACGGAPPEEPAPEPEPAPAAAAPAPAQEPVAPDPEPEPDPEPAAPQLEGNIVTSGEDFDWISVTDRNSPATYYWTVAINNDTTQNLDITVKFDFVDENEGVVKTETKTVRLAPAGNVTIREEGDMSYQDALKVVGFVSELSDWTIVGG